MPDTTPIPLVDRATARPQAQDKRPLIPEPLPVRLLTVADAHLPRAGDWEQELDAFYVTLLGFEREHFTDALGYRADNFRLLFDVPRSEDGREDLRALGIQVPSLAEAEQKLSGAEIEYVRQKSLNPGLESLLLRDPCGNWIELSPFLEFR